MTATIFDPDRPIEIHTEALGVGAGAVLIQEYQDNVHVIAYTGQTLSKKQKNYGAIPLERF